MSFSKTISLLIFVLFICANTKAQTEYTPNLKQAHHEILSLRFATAENILKKEPLCAAKIWLASYQTFINFLTTRDAINPREQIKFYDQQVEKLSQEETNSAFITLGIIDNYLFKAYTHLTLKEYLWAGTSYAKAQRLINKLKTDWPTFYANQRNTLIGIVADVWMTENLPFVNRIKNITDIKNNYKNIVNKANVDSNMPIPFKRELEIISLLLYPYIEKSNDKIWELTYLLDSNWYKIGPIESFAYANFAQRAHHFEQEYTALNYAYNANYNSWFNRLNLNYGDYLLKQLNTSGIGLLNEFVNSQKNQRAVAYAQLKQGWHYCIIEEQAQQKQIIKVISKTTATNTPEDEQALYEVKYADYWLKSLISSRLLFDGGNYQQSLNYLYKAKNQYDSFHNYQKITYHYQMARNYQRLNQPEQAILHFKKVCEFDLQDTFYYNCYAYYYMGELFKQIGEFNPSKTALNACLKCNSPIYQASIHQKARALLKQL